MYKMSNLPEFTGVGEALTSVNELEQSDVAFFDFPKPAPEYIIARHTDHIPPANDIGYEFAPVSFEVKNVGAHYLDFSKTHLVGSFKVTKADGSKLDDNTEVAIINNFPHALWNNIDIIIDGTLQVELSTNRYAYKAYFEQLLSYSKQSEGHTKPLSLWHLDTAGKYDECTAENIGYTERKALIAGSKECHFHTPLLIDFMALNRLYPNCSSIVLRLSRNPVEFLLMAADTSKQYKIKIVNLLLKIDKVTLNPQLYKATELQWYKQNMIFSYDKCKILEFSIKQNQTLVDFNDIHSGQIPKYFLMGMVRQASLTGSFAENPFNFATNNIIKLYCKVNGQIVPSYPYEFDFASNPKKCLTAFASLYDELGINRADKQHYINMEQFTGGAFIMPFSFCPDSCFGRNLHPLTSGQISLHMQFSTGLTSSWTLLLFAVFDEAFELDVARQITFPRGRLIP